MNKDVVFLAARRTPIGKFQGKLSDVPATQLGSTAIRAAVSDSLVDPARIDEVLMGHVLQAAAGQAPARQAALGAGIPASIGATTINKVCGSGMKTIMLGAQAIRIGDADLIVAGGMENMFLAPYALPGARSGYRLLDRTVVDLAVHDGLWCSLEDWHMGSAAEWVASHSSISRDRQDDFAVRSHRRAIAAIEGGAFVAEIAPVEVPVGRGQLEMVDTDESPRRDTSVEALAKLKPAFNPDGTVTAGNAPGLSHGGAAVVLAGADWAAAQGARPIARLVGYAQAAVPPKEIFLAPVLGVRRLLERTGLELSDFDLIEINEAFAAQVLADGDQLDGWNWDRVNVRGGAIALGHPIGCSGTRILVTLLHALQQTGGKRGLATACLGGGEAVAMAVELV